MKHKFGCLFASIILSMTLTGCGPLFRTNSERKVESVFLDISNCPGDYAPGDRLLDNFDCQVSKVYNDGSRELLGEDEYDFILIRNSNRYDVAEPFTDLGDYSLRARYIEMNLYSNVCTITVNSKHQYTQSLSFEGPSTIAVGTKAKIEVKTTRYPNFNGYLSAVANNNCVNIYRTGDTTFELVGLQAGQTTITFTASSNATKVIRENFNLVVESPVVIKQNYHMLETRRESDSVLPPTGNVKMLVIPIWFSDSINYLGGTDKNGNEISSTQASINIREDIRTAFFGESDSDDWDSVASFYYKDSFGKLNITGVVGSWYNSGHPSTDFYDDRDLIDSTIKNAVDVFFTMNPNENRVDYDSDHDGYLDAVCFVYACPSYSNLGRGEMDNMWAWKSLLQNKNLKNVNNPGLNPFTWQSYTFMYNATSCKNRTGQVFPRMRGLNQFTISSETFSHEVGHLFGINDLYDLNHNLNLTGGYNMQTDDKGGHDPYSVMSFGWANPYIPVNSGTATINDFQNTHELILLTPEWNAFDSPFDEYFLLELYTPTKLNHFYSEELHDAPGIPGIRLWHIDARLVNMWEEPVYTSDVNDKYANLANNNTSIKNSSGVIEDDDYLVTLVRNDTTFGRNPTKILEEEDLFYVGDSFNMDDYSSQFRRGNKLNSNKKLGWEFEVLSIDYHYNEQYSATIRLTKTA